MQRDLVNEIGPQYRPSRGNVQEIVGPVASTAKLDVDLLAHSRAQGEVES